MPPPFDPSACQESHAVSALCRPDDLLTAANPPFPHFPFQAPLAHCAHACGAERSARRAVAARNRGPPSATGPELEKDHKKRASPTPAKNSKAETGAQHMSGQAKKKKDDPIDATRRVGVGSGTERKRRGHEWPALCRWEVRTGRGGSALKATTRRGSRARSGGGSVGEGGEAGAGDESVCACQNSGRFFPACECTVWEEGDKSVTGSGSPTLGDQGISIKET